MQHNCPNGHKLDIRHSIRIRKLQYLEPGFDVVHCTCKKRMSNESFRHYTFNKTFAITKCRYQIRRRSFYLQTTKG